MKQRTDINSNRRAVEFAKSLMAEGGDRDRSILASSLLSARVSPKLIEAAKVRASEEGKTFKELIA
jgi:hypothetical protein